MTSFVKPNVTDLFPLSRHVTDNVTDNLEKNLGKTVFVTLSRLNTPAEGRYLIFMLLFDTTVDFRTALAVNNGS
jgi:hypothetical protein